jgi:hypothetical protein
MSDVDHKVILFCVLAVGGLAAFLLSQDKLRAGFVFLVCTLGLGYRTFPVTSQLRVHPAEVCLLLLTILVLARRTPHRLPRWLWLFMPFWVLGWLPSHQNSQPWDLQVSEFRNFLLLIPVFLVTPAVLNVKGGWRSIILTFWCVGCAVATLGVLERAVPGIRDALPGFVTDPTALMASDGFQRAKFSFWGGPQATFLCVLAMPLTALVWRWWPSQEARVGTLAGLVLQVAAVYIGGYRSMWLLAAVQFLLFAVFQKRFVLATLVLLIAFGGYSALPAETRERIHTLRSVLAGGVEELDTSGVKRWNRAQDTVEYALRTPFGHGWAESGWVHSDFLQVAANLGPPAALVFLGGYVVTLVRLPLRMREVLPANELAPVGLSVALSFVGAGGMLLFEGVQVLPQLALPVWLVWAMAETWLRQTSPIIPDARARRLAPRRFRYRGIWPAPRETVNPGERKWRAL